MEFVTHERCDLDGIAGIVLLSEFLRDCRKEKVKIYFWDGDREKLKHIHSSGVSSRVIFVDVAPPKRYSSDLIFDHHNAVDEKEEITATYKVVRYLVKHSGLRLDNEKGKDNERGQRVKKIARWTQRADYEGVESETLANLIKRMHLTSSDQEVFDWAKTAILAFLKARKVTFELKDFQRSFNEFRRILKEYQEKDSQNDLFKKWLGRPARSFSDPMSLPRMFDFVWQVFGEKRAKEWLKQGLTGIQEDQKAFRDAEKDYERAEKVKIGTNYVIIAMSNNPSFQRYARMRGKQEFGKAPIVIQIGVGERTFQIFSNGQVPLYEVAGALRAEILKKQGFKIPFWRELKKPGILEGTTLYFRKAKSHFLGWGSLTHSTAPSWKRIFGTKEKLVSVILQVIDPEWWPEECKKRNRVSKEVCRACPVYHWHLKRCYEKRCFKKGRT